MMNPTFLQRIARKLDKSLANPFFIDQWAILTAHDMDFRSLDWQELHPIIPDKDRYWGDPFVLEKEGHYFVFVEEKLYTTGRGRIACLELDTDGRLLEHHPVLERGYHLSYPFVFEHASEVFMIPETSGNRSVEIFRCTRFPYQWEFSKQVMRDIYAVDTTMLEHDGRAWLFANVKIDAGSSLNALHLYWAPSPFAESWTPHPCNPVVRDICSARPAGRVFMQDGMLIRPSQDSSRRYGYALNFNRITKLSEDEYTEEIVARFLPEGGRIKATHTFNQAGGLTVIDAVIRRNR